MVKIQDKSHYRPGEVAEIMDVSLDTIYRAMSKGLIVHVHVGRNHRIPRSEVVRIMESGIMKALSKRATPA